MASKTSITGIDIDEKNLKKIQKHGVSLETIQKFFSQEFFILNDPEHSKDEIRFWGFGIVDERRILIVFTIREINGERKFRPISARNCHKKEWELLNEKISGKKS